MTRLPAALRCYLWTFYLGCGAFLCLQAVLLFRGGLTPLGSWPFVAGVALFGILSYVGPAEPGSCVAQSAQARPSHLRNQATQRRPHRAVCRSLGWARSPAGTRRRCDPWGDQVSVPDVQGRRQVARASRTVRGSRLHRQAISARMEVWSYRSCAT